MASRGVVAPKGLAPAQPTQGMIIVYATQSGHVALDGGAARNSPFARAFVDALNVPGLEVAALFRRMEEKVSAAKRRPAIAGTVDLRRAGILPYGCIAGSEGLGQSERRRRGRADRFPQPLSGKPPMRRKRAKNRKPYKGLRPETRWRRCSGNQQKRAGPSPTTPPT